MLIVFIFVIPRYAKIVKNVIGTELKICSHEPMTGFFRDGFCRTDDNDVGRHVVACVMTDDFLNFTRSMGNDLITPNPEFGFPGLKEGDKWCVCALRWKEAHAIGLAPPVILEATHVKTLEFIDLSILVKMSLSNQDLD